MTYFHLFTCLTLVFAPQWVVYKGTKISEYSHGNKNFILGIIACIITQLLKMLILATFSSTSDSTSTTGNSHISSSFIYGHPVFNFGNGSIFWIIQEAVLKVITHVAEFFALYLLFSTRYISGERECKILATGLGWSFCENVSSRLIPMIYGAVGLEFEWTYLQMAILSNFNLVLYLSLATIVFFHSSSWKQTTNKWIANSILVLYVLISLITEFSNFLFPSDLKDSIWMLLSVYGLLTLVTAIAAKSLYKSWKID